jgi:hypothetical protein
MWNKKEHHNFFGTKRTNLNETNRYLLGTKSTKLSNVRKKNYMFGNRKEEHKFSRTK